MKKLKLPAIGLILIYLAGCSTTGNLRTDMEKLDLVFAGKKSQSRLDIEFTVPPGIASATTEMFVTGAFIKGHGAVDTKPIAFDMAKEVFSRSFSQVGFVEPGSPQKTDHYLLKLQAHSSTSAMDGSHTADVRADFFNLDNSRLLTTRVKHSVDDIRYAQEEPMRRAYLRAFNDIAWKIQAVLSGDTASDDPGRADLMSTSREVIGEFSIGGSTIKYVLVPEVDDEIVRQVAEAYVRKAGIKKGGGVEPVKVQPLSEEWRKSCLSTEAGQAMKTLCGAEFLVRQNYKGSYNTRRLVWKECKLDKCEYLVSDKGLDIPE